MTPLHEELLREFQDFARTAPTDKAVMERISSVCMKRWRGTTGWDFIVDPADPGALIVGPFRRELHAERSHSAQYWTLRGGGHEWEDGGGARRV